MDDVGDKLNELWASHRALVGTVASRKKREARGMPGRRPSGRETKTAQLNIKITPTFKRRLEGFAKGRSMSIAEYIEMVVNTQEGMGQ